MCGEFKNEFYSGQINFQYLADTLRTQLSNDSFVFDYHDYISREFSEAIFQVNSPFSGFGGPPRPSMIDVIFPSPPPATNTSPNNPPSGGGAPPPVSPPNTAAGSFWTDKPFEYTGILGEKVQARFHYAKLNYLRCYVENRLVVSVGFNGKKLSIGLKLMYRNTSGFRVQASDTPMKSDTRIADKYCAIIIKEGDAEDILAFVSYVHGSDVANSYRRYITESILYYFDNAKSDTEIKALYEQAPIFALAQRPDKQKLNDLEQLLRYDKGNWYFDGLFKDSSAAMVRCLMGFNNRNIIYERYHQNPYLLVDLYHYLGDSGKEALCTLIETLVLDYRRVNVNSGIRPVATFKLDKRHSITSDIMQATEGTINLQNVEQGVKERYSPIEKGKISFNTQHVINSGSYHPMDFVTVVGIVNDKTQQKEVLVLNLKRLADTEEWEDIMTSSRIALDLLAILLAASTLGTSTALVMGSRSLAVAINILELALGTVDILILAKPEHWGKDAGLFKDFLDNWDGIYLFGGVLAASPLLLETTFTQGLNLARIAQNVTSKNFIQSCMLKLVIDMGVLEVNIAAKVRRIEMGFEVFYDSGIHIIASQMLRLEEAGVKFVKVMDELGEALAYIAFYKGKPIASGTAEELRETLKGAFGKTDTALELELKELLESFYRSIRNVLSELQEADEVTKTWNKLAPMRDMSRSDVNLLESWRRIYSGLPNTNPATMSVANVARMRLKLRINGKIIEFEYKAFSNFGNFPEGFCPNPSKQYVAKNLEKTVEEVEELFKTVEGNKEMRRFNDSEHKILAVMDDELHKLFAKHGRANVEVVSMHFQSLFEPCVSCKRMILIRKQVYNIPKVIVEATPFEARYVKGNDEFLKSLK